MSTRRNAGSLRAQIDAVVDADWSHSAWWLLTWLTGILERVGGPHRAEDRVGYHGANGGPHSDTFMARPRTRAETDVDPTRESLSEWGARHAFAGLSALGDLADQLPGQPLQVLLTWNHDWLEVAPLPAEDRGNVVFTVGGAHYLADVGAMKEEALAAGLDRLLLGSGSPPGGFRKVDTEGPVTASLVVSLDVHHHDVARHTHRRAWNRFGGPWLGIARTPTLDLVTTCHLVVDGLGHALLTDRILTDRIPAQSINPTRGHFDSDPPHRGRRPEALPTGLAWAYRPEGVGRFAEQAFATGITLEDFFGAGGHTGNQRRYSPPFTVPVAPGASDDAGRRLGRVVHGLLSVRRTPGAADNSKTLDRFEPFQVFNDRLGPWLEVERSGRGILARISSAVSRGPLPRSLKHLALTNHHGPRASIPSVEGLSGRARLSSIRFPGASVTVPLIAASLPTLLPNNDDGRGGVVLTLIHHDEGTTVTVFGTGKAASESGARAFLDQWLAALDDIRKG